MNPPFVPNVLEVIPEDHHFKPLVISKKSIIPSAYSSKKYSATGGTGGGLKYKTPNKILGDF